MRLAISRPLGLRHAQATTSRSKVRRFFSLAFIPLLIVLSFALSSCSSNEAASPKFFPLNKGWKWTYQMVTVTDFAGTQTETFTTENLGKKDYGAGLEGWERRNSLGNFYLFRVDSAGVYRTAVRNEIEDEMRADPDKPRRFVLKEPMSVGTFWQQNTLPFLMRRSVEWPFELKHGKPVTMNFEVEGLDQTVQVQAGEFKGCMLISGRVLMRLYIDAVVGFQDIPVSQKEWYCPEVGLVKLTRDETIKARWVTGGTQSFELVEFSR